MFQNDKTVYNNRRQMEETTARVFARLHNMKTILCKTLKSTLTVFHNQSFVPNVLNHFSFRNLLWYQIGS